VKPITKVIVGLGNPGLKYKNNRHNIGFMVVDKIAKTSGSRFKRSLRFNASLAKVDIDREKVLLVKPRTYMNNSGVCVRRILASYKNVGSNLLIVYDDVDLTLGMIRLREKGSSGGHKGIASIIDELGQNLITRVKVGIEDTRKGNRDLAEYVLSDFGVSEKDVLDRVLTQAAAACIDWVAKGSSFVMQKYNKTLK
jgi:PTH1 family peptidyl-tRNA hydrolase